MAKLNQLSLIHRAQNVSLPYILVQIQTTKW